MESFTRDELLFIAALLMCRAQDVRKIISSRSYRPATGELRKSDIDYIYSLDSLSLKAWRMAGLA